MPHEECPHDCNDGHLPGCDCARPAFDLGDIMCRRPCLGCCPLHKPSEHKMREHVASAELYELVDADYDHWPFACTREEMASGAALPGYADDEEPFDAPANDMKGPA